jgi:transcriptional regulator with XRE-family HTH domain
MNQSELAQKLGVSHQFLSKWRAGKSGIKPETAEAWARILKVDPADLIFAPVEKRSELLGIDN